MSSGIYSITNKTNDKIYIGSSTNIEERWKFHKKSLKSNKHHSIHLQRAYNKYGKFKFDFKILEIVKSKRNYLLKREQYWMDTFKSPIRKYGYNICPDAMGHDVSDETREKNRQARLGKTSWNKGLSGYKLHSKESKAKISKASKGNTYRKNSTHSKEFVKKISKRMQGNTYRKGMKFSKKTLKQMSDVKKGKKFTKEHKRKISNARNGMKFTKEHRKNISLGRLLAIKNGLIPWLKGKTMSKEQRLTMSKARKGMKLTKKHRLNIGKSLKKFYKNKRNKLHVK